MYSTTSAGSLKEIRQTKEDTLKINDGIETKVSSLPLIILKIIYF